MSFLIINDGQTLLGKRSKSKESVQGLITIPADHIEAGETRFETMIREHEEELSIKPKLYGYLCSLYHPTNELQLILLRYVILA